jgi:NAD(P)-dependent dehydrogenase (short-subunit alcohol dehydrogenase family)
MGWLEYKVVAVTGAGRGIGRAIAQRLAAEGANVVVADFGGAMDALSDASTRPAQAVVDEIKAAGGQAVPFTESIATMRGGANMVDLAVATYGRLDGLVCCAGLMPQNPVWDVSEEEWDDAIASHLKGHFACTKAAALVMMRQRSGSIVHFASTSALIAPAHQPAYTTAKAGVMGFARSCALSLGQHGIRVNCILPGAATRMTDAAYRYAGVRPETLAPGVLIKSEDAAGTWRDPANVAPFIVFLLSDRANGINGQSFAVVGYQVSHVRERTFGRTIRSDGPWKLDDLAQRFDADLAPELGFADFPWPPP